MCDNPARRAAGEMRGKRARILVAVVVVLAAAAWAPVPIAEHFADGPGAGSVVRVDPGWEFVYQAVRLSRDARLGTDEQALDTARQVWAARRRSRARSCVTPTALRGAGGPGGAPRHRGVAVPGSRWRGSWRTTRRLNTARVRQMIGLLDYRSGRVAWTSGRRVSGLRRRACETRQSRQRKTQRNLIIAVRRRGRGRGGAGVRARRQPWASRDGELKETRLGQNTRIYDRTARSSGSSPGSRRTVVPGGRSPRSSRTRRSSRTSATSTDYYRLLGAGLRDLENARRQGAARSRCSS